MQVIEFKVTEKENGMTVGAILRYKLELSAARISAAKHFDDGITISRKRVFTNYRAKTGDIISVRIDDKPASVSFCPVEYPLDILYEDEYLLILNKEAGMTVYKSTDCISPTLAGAVVNYLGKDAVIHAVSRLDKGTSGIIVYCKSGYVHEKLCRMQHSGDFNRIYRAVVMGTPDPTFGKIDAPIIRKEGIRRAVGEGGQNAVTLYETEKTNGIYSLLKISLMTGRTHQIRVHMAHIGNPLVGDFLYGKEEPELIKRPALHSSELLMRHPVTGEMLHIVCALPDDFNFFK